ncbi:MAG TPA: fructose-bisphosphatase class II, partial [Stellaceae bacterium]|nr:fructose-bisphosphatase class II [Stellaceae bacterium]
RRVHGGAFTHSVVMRSKTGTVRYVEAKHDFTRKQQFVPLGR